MKKNASERGSAMMLVVVIVLILVGVSGAYMSISWWNTRRAFQDESASQALYIAESGAALYINDLNANKTAVLGEWAKKGMSGGSYWIPKENIVNFANGVVVGAANQDPDYAAFQVAGKYNGVVRRLNVLLTHKAGGVFWNAIYAGNRSSDPNYTLNLTGDASAKTQDRVKGNIFSAQNVAATGDAELLDEDGKGKGKVTYKGTNTSTVSANYVQGDEPALDIQRKFGPGKDQLQAEYMSQTFNGTRDPKTGTAWVDVAGQFETKGKDNKWVDGSTARDVLDVNNPAHIFRKDPSSTSGGSNNRTGTYEYTIPSTSVINGRTGKPRHDYYVEDPTNTKVTQPSLTGVPVNGDTSASMLNVQPNGNNAVYYVEGNMRVSGEPIKSYQFNPAPGTGDLKMTFIVKGNVSLTDNLLYPNWESKTDAIAIIAVQDPDFPNALPGQFAPGSSGKVTENGISSDAFIAQYNAKAKQARKDGLNMPDLDVSTAAGQARAAQEYNKVYGSGNVFFGDPGSGTVEHFEGYLYAENNFYATNLDTTMGSGGTQKMEIYGNMTAGNHVDINRSVKSGGGYAGYIPLRVSFDPKISMGNKPPGLPDDMETTGKDWRIVSWKQSVNTAETDNKKETESK